MVQIFSDVRYLSAAQLDQLDLTMAQIIDILEAAFRAKAEGKVMMPPKIFFHRNGPRFYSSMVSASPALGYAGCKWQSGDPENPARDLPYIQGLYILTEDASGQMRAIMDAEWITGRRTAAASGLVVKYQARADAKTLGILGCGLQGRRHLEAVHAVRPDITHCLCYDIQPDRQQKFIDEMSGTLGFRVEGGVSAEAVARAADVLITGGPIESDRNPIIQPDWIRTGALVVTIDYDSYVTDAAIQAMDLVLTDDEGQIADARRNEGKFPGVTRIDATVADLVTSGTGRRASQVQRILAFNLGIALEDLATAIEIFGRAEAKDIGTLLPLRNSAAP
jgi:ornithine cyclodeaminase/alanine dehydrogenase